MQHRLLVGGQLLAQQAFDHLTAIACGKQGVELAQHTRVNAEDGSGRQGCGHGSAHFLGVCIVCAVCSFILQVKQGSGSVDDLG